MPTRPTKDALAAAQAAGAEARQAVDDVRTAEAAVAAAEAQIAAIDARMAAPVAQPVAAAPATTGATNSEADKTAAQSELTRAQAALVEARAREATKSPAAFAAVETWKRAVAASEAAGALVDEADRRQRAGVGVHQQEGRPHLHPPGLEGSVGGARHLPRSRPSARHAHLHGDRRGAGRLVDELDGDIHAAREPVRRRPGAGARRTSPRKPSPTAAAPETAAGALDRIELPDGARERIAELLWSGGSLIVSDNPRSGEMSEYSDFIVLTR